MNEFHVSNTEIAEKLRQFPDTFQSVKDSLLRGNGYWFPLKRDFAPEYKTAVYRLDPFYKRGTEKINLLKNVFAEAGISGVKGFHPYRYEGQSTWLEIPDIKTFLYETDASGCTFHWINEEYYFDTTETWLIYVSHEATITFCGERLAAIAEALLPEEDKYC